MLARLEIIACSLADAKAAEAGGADRLELCRRLDLAGLTPPLRTVDAACGVIKAPMRVMIRTNRGFTATPEELTEMERQVAELAALPIEGVVCGFLDASGALDLGALDRVLRLAPPHWQLTIHRAFETAAGEPEEKFEQVRRHGRADRVMAGPDLVRRLVRLSDQRLQVMAGGGLNMRNVPEWAEWAVAGGCREFHVGRAVRTPEESTAPVDQGKVRRFRELLDRHFADSVSSDPVKL